MARPKSIDDNILKNLINKYYLENNGSLKSKKFSTITDYIQKNGYPDYRASSLRRNSVATDYIEKLWNESNENKLPIAFAYKTLNVDAFLSKNKTPLQIRAALTELDKYSASIYDAAVLLKEENNKLTQQLEYIQSKEKETKFIEKEYEDKISELKKELTAIKKELIAYKDFVEKNVYPETASFLLEETGILKNHENKYLNENSAIEDVITSNTCISAEESIVENSELTNEKNDLRSGSNIIKGLFNEWRF